MRWEYRVRTISHADDDEDTRTLTNTARPASYEVGRGGWEIFAVIPVADKLRLFMKRVAQ